MDFVYSQADATAALANSGEGRPAQAARAKARAAKAEAKARAKRLQELEKKVAKRRKASGAREPLCRTLQQIFARTRSAGERPPTTTAGTSALN